MDAAWVIGLYNKFLANGIQTYVDGGWCVDALLGRETRPHADLDIAVERKDAARLHALLAEWGYTKEQRRDSTEWNYAMKDGHHAVDVHVFEYDDQGTSVYGIEYPFGSLRGEGTINGQKVKCISPEWIFKFKTSYLPQEKDRQDVHHLAAAYGFAIPETHR
jgi:lincosamide nucleotidyltransferase A/C/D/E